MGRSAKGKNKYVYMYIFIISPFLVILIAYQKLKISVNFEAQFQLNYVKNFGFHLTKDTPCLHYHDQPINPYCTNVENRVSS